MRVSGTSGLLSQPARLGGVLGIAFLVLFIVAIIAQGEAPATSDPAAEIREFFVDNRDTYLISDFLIGVALVFLFLPYGICLYMVLSRAEGGAEILSRLFLAGVILTLAIGAAGGIAWGTLALAAGDETVDDSTIKAMMYMGQYSSTGISFTFALTALAGSLVMLMTSAPARWTGYVGLAAFVLNLIGAAWIIDGDEEGVLSILALIGLLMFAIWTLCNSIAMLRSGQPHAMAVEPAAA